MERNIYLNGRKLSKKELMEEFKDTLYMVENKITPCGKPLSNFRLKEERENLGELALAILNYDICD